MKKWIARQKLRITAQWLGFPTEIKNRYIYGCQCGIGPPAFKAWEKFMQENDLDTDYLYPINRTGDVIATYRLVKVIPRSRRGSDYAGSDTCSDGNFGIERIDIIPPNSELETPNS